MDFFFDDLSVVAAFPPPILFFALCRFLLWYTIVGSFLLDCLTGRFLSGCLLWPSSRLGTIFALCCGGRDHTLGDSGGRGLWASLTCGCGGLRL